MPKTIARLTAKSPIIRRMTEPQFAAIVLAAGKGTRMRSEPAQGAAPDRQPADDRACAGGAGAARARRGPWWSSRPSMDAVGEGGRARPRPRSSTSSSAPAHAVAAARDALAGFTGDVLVLCGDAPLVTTATLAALLAERRRAPEAAAVVLGMRPADPGAYGRLVTGPDGDARGDRRGARVHA